MAWIDDRIWCHPKIVGLSPQAFRVYINGVAYSSGMALSGRLDASHQKLLGATRKTRGELVTARLWDVAGDDGTITIHDWEEHNSKRDERRARDRERKKQERETDPDGWITRSGQWTRTRQDVFERDKGVCVDCGKHDEHWHADHVPERSELRAQGLNPFEIRFIQTRCRPCHSRKHSLERHAQRKRHGEQTDLRTDVRTEGGKLSGTARVEGSEGSDRTTTGAAERLKAAGWSTTQLAEVDDFARAVAWLDLAVADPNCQSVGALSWSMFKKGGWPEQAVTIANGAQGTRSVIPKRQFVCECGVDFNSKPAYEDHLGNVHGVVRA